jgi:diketogulonate reductase-like aldo/keto reductase
MIDRRNFIRYAGAGMTTLSCGAWAQSQETLPTRSIPGSDASLPIIGLGNSQVFRDGDMAASLAVIDRFHGRGGRYVDCMGLSRFVVAEVAKAMGAGNELFLGTYFMDEEEPVMRDNAQRLLQITGKSQLDLMHAYTEFAVDNWELFRRWKDEGLTRFIGMARHNARYYEDMMTVMKTGTVDFIQVNYSALEREAEDAILPMAMDLGIAVTINRPFINGDYFKLVSGHELPEWAAEFGAVSWAQFGLKFILSHPAVTCVLTETANPEHAVDNIGAGFGPLPDAETRERIFAHLKGLQ